jgi:hypothetical protein
MSDEVTKPPRERDPQQIALNRERARADGFKKSLAATRVKIATLERELKATGAQHYEAGSAEAITAIYCALADLGADPLDAAQWVSHKLSTVRGHASKIPLPEKVEALARESIALYIAEWRKLARAAKDY